MTKGRDGTAAPSDRARVDSAADSARRAVLGFEAARALLAAERDDPRTDREALTRDALAALEAARTGRRHATESIELLMEILVEAGVGWPVLGFGGPEDG